MKALHVRFTALWRRTGSLTTAPAAALPSREQEAGTAAEQPGLSTNPT